MNLEISKMKYAVLKFIDERKGNYSSSKKKEYSSTASKQKSLQQYCESFLLGLNKRSHKLQTSVYLKFQVRFGAAETLVY